MRNVLTRAAPLLLALAPILVGCGEGAPKQAAPQQAAPDEWPQERATAAREAAASFRKHSPGFEREFMIDLVFIPCSMDASAKKPA